MTRRTPLSALLLAPVVLVALAALWFWALQPLAHAIWSGPTVVQWRLGSGDAATRERALLQALSSRVVVPEVVARITALATDDPAASVRQAALRALGHLGAREPLPDAARQVLATAATTTAAAATGTVDVAQLDAALTAIGASAALNRYPDAVARHAARWLAGSESRLQRPAIAALGSLGAAQPLPDNVIEALQAALARRDSMFPRDALVAALAQIAAARPLPPALLDRLADAAARDEPRQVRIPALLALAHGAAAHPPAEAAVAALLNDADPTIRDAARQGQTIIETKRLFGARAPIDVALDRTAPPPARLRAIASFDLRRDDAKAREQFAALAGDDDRAVAAAALGKLAGTGYSPDDAFDRERLLPLLRSALAHPDPALRLAAFRALSSLMRNDARRAEPFRAALDAGANDADAGVRMVALATLVRIAPDAAAADAVRARALRDPDPAVRQVAAGALASPRASYADRRSLIDLALRDPVAAVRDAAAAAEREWLTKRDASWPRQLLRMLRDGEFGKLGFAALSFVTIAAPIAVGGGFLLYFTARLLTELAQRRWRALALLPVIAAWIAASFGVFMLYFAAGHLRWTEPVAIAQGVAVLWAAVALYAALGWGMHRWVRR